MIKKVLVRQMIVVVAAGGLLTFSSGCERISEPWVRAPRQLEQERNRPEPVRTALRHRLLAVQTDR